MDCCCHLDLLTRNLDGLPKPKNVFKKGQRQLFISLLFSKCIYIQLYMGTYGIPITATVSWQKRSQALRKHIKNFVFQDRKSDFIEAQHILNISVSPSQEKNAVQLV